MGNFLDRLVGRSRGNDPIVRPQLEPVFGAVPQTSGYQNFVAQVPYAPAQFPRDAIYGELDVSKPAAFSKDETQLEPVMVARSEEPEVNVARAAPESPRQAGRAEIAPITSVAAAESLFPIATAQLESVTHTTVASHHRLREQVNGTSAKTTRSSIAEDTSAAHRSRESDRPSSAHSALIESDEGSVLPRVRPLLTQESPSFVDMSVGRFAGHFSLLSPESSQPIQTVQVTIGRVEVRMNSPENKPERKTRAVVARPSLNDHLRDRARTRHT